MWEACAACCLLLAACCRTLCDRHVPCLHHHENHCPMGAQLRVEIASTLGLEHLSHIQRRLGFGHIEQEGALLGYGSERDLWLPWHYLIEPSASMYCQKPCCHYLSALEGLSRRVYDDFQRDAHNWTLDARLGPEQIMPNPTLVTSTSKQRRRCKVVLLLPSHNCLCCDVLVTCERGAMSVPPQPQV